MTSTTEYSKTITSLLPAEQVATLRTAREQVEAAKQALAKLTEGKSRAETKLRELTTHSATRGAAVAAAFVDGSAAVALPDNQREVDDVRLAVATLGDQIIAATSALKEWQTRVTAAEVALLKALQREAAKHFAEVADSMQAAFSLVEATHRALELLKAQTPRPGAWWRLAIPPPDHGPRRVLDDSGFAWSAERARSTGQCAHVTDMLQSMIAE
jgi:hypothetical protein